MENKTKTVLGLDLGTNSIGWALVKEDIENNSNSNIIDCGVRVIPLTSEEIDNFEKGKSITTNKDRTQKRHARRNLHRFKLRRKVLIETLKKAGIIDEQAVLTEDGKGTTHELIRIRAQAADQQIKLDEFARVLLAINKKRGYKSSRKTKSAEEGEAIDSMDIAKILYEKNLTPGEYVLNLLEKGKNFIPDFYPSDLQEEFNRIWEKQKEYYPEILTDELKKEVINKSGRQTWTILKKPFNIVGIKRTGKKHEQRLENYQWRVEALKNKLDLEQLAIVLQEINTQLNRTSGYLGEISDRSKQLYLNKITVGQYLYNQIKENPHNRLKNQVFYRQDYLDEFNKIWDTQSKFYPDILSPELKKEIRDIIIFYQRPLKSQKGLISICELEGREAEIKVDGKTKKKVIGPRVIPKSSPLFQEFKIWQRLNDIIVKNPVTKEEYYLSEEHKNIIFEEVNLKGKISDKELLKLLGLKSKDWEVNFKTIEGNSTNAELLKAYQEIINTAGYDNQELKKMDAGKAVPFLEELFESLGINKHIVKFSTDLPDNEIEKQPHYQLWHLLYSYEGDNSKSGNESLYKHLKEKFGIEKEYAQPFIKINFKSDYGNLSAKAIKKILPHLKDGKDYSEAAQLAGYNHSHSFTKKENLERELVDKLEILPKNSLRNPVVEKILNQMINVVNAIIDEYGKPDEIRIELARELKKSAKERQKTTEYITKSTKEHEQIKKILEKMPPFNQGVRITRNDIIKYKLWKELEPNKYHTLYSNQYIPLEKLFSKEIDVEHIIPKALLYDDSFSNKTLEYRNVNLEKGDRTAYDYMIDKYGENSEEFKRYITVIEELYKDGKISKGKFNKLLMKQSEIPDDFIERDLRNTQYIAKKAKELLLKLVRTVVPTSGTVTDKLRQDWGLVDIMKELNWDKYNQLGLTDYEETKDGKRIKIIKDWSKRNDQRHHAMDAITIAFTTHNHIQYLNNLNTIYNLHEQEEVQHDKSNLYGIKEKITELVEDKNGNKKRKFKKPMPNLRSEAKKHLENILVSYKAKNKVVTQNKNYIKVSANNPRKNKIKRKGKHYLVQDTLTPRGQLHNETIYGKIKQPLKKPVKLSKKFTAKQAELIINKEIKQTVLNHLAKYNNKHEIAFESKTLKKTP